MTLARLMILHFRQICLMDARTFIVFVPQEGKPCAAARKKATKMGYPGYSRLNTAGPFSVMATECSK